MALPVELARLTRLVALVALPGGPRRIDSSKMFGQMVTVQRAGFA
jgi:hypothetical protein